MIIELNKGLALCASLLSLTLSACHQQSIDDAEDGRGRRFPGANIVLISIDTLRADHLSLYGYTRPTSPRLDEFARDAITFTNFVNNGGGTLPVHMTMMTGLPPLAHNVLEKNERTLDPGRITLAEQLSDEGYRTVAFVDSGYVRAKFGFDQGFDLYDDQGGGFAEILPKTLEWLDAGASSTEPFFLFVHTYDVHSKWRDLPYSCPGYQNRYAEGALGSWDGCAEGLCASSLLLSINENVRANIENSSSNIVDSSKLKLMKDLYDGCINYADDQLAILFNRLHDLGLFENSIVVVTSDHGEEFLENGLFLHQNPFFETNMRIPFILRLPGGAKTEVVVDRLASTSSIMPTLLDLLDIPVNNQVIGSSLTRSIWGNEEVVEYVHIMGGALRTDRKKFIARGDQEHFFDLLEDPLEQRNLVSDHVDEARAMKKSALQAANSDKRAFDEFIEQQSETSAVPRRLLPQEIEQLRALGYVVEDAQSVAGLPPDIDSQKDDVLLAHGYIGEKVMLRSRIIFSEDPGSSLQLVRGFYEHETNHRWVSGDARILLGRPEKAKSWRISGWVDLDSHGVEYLGIRVGIDKNEPTLQWIRSSGQFALEGPLPESSENDVVLDIFCDHEFRPADVPKLGNANDVRRLCVFLNAIEIR